MYYLMSWNQTIFSSGADRKQLKPIPSERIKKIERSKTDNQPKLTMILLCFHDITSLYSLFLHNFSYRFGRKPVFFFTMILQTVTALIQVTSVSWVMFTILNCLRGLGQISNFIASLVLGKTAHLLLSHFKKSRHVFSRAETKCSAEPCFCSSVWQWFKTHWKVVLHQFILGLKNLVVLCWGSLKKH